VSVPVLYKPPVAEKVRVPPALLISRLLATVAAVLDAVQVWSPVPFKIIPAVPEIGCAVKVKAPPILRVLLVPVLRTVAPVFTVVVPVEIRLQFVSVCVAAAEKVIAAAVMSYPPVPTKVLSIPAPEVVSVDFRITLEPRVTVLSAILRVML
jgi:hypothetical protein